MLELRQVGIVVLRALGALGLGRDRFKPCSAKVIELSDMLTRVGALETTS